MRRGFERRLRRLEALAGRWAAERERRREVLGAREIVARTIRAGLAHAGLDPDKALTLRRFEQRDPPPRREMTGQPAGSGPLDILRGRLLALARHCREAPADLATASPAMLLAAYCFGDGPAGWAASGAET